MSGPDSLNFSMADVMYDLSFILTLSRCWFSRVGSGFFLMVGSGFFHEGRRVRVKSVRIRNPGSSNTCSSLLSQMLSCLKSGLAVTVVLACICSELRVTLQVNNSFELEMDAYCYQITHGEHIKINNSIMTIERGWWDSCFTFYLVMQSIILNEYYERKASYHKTHIRIL